MHHVGTEPTDLVQPLLCSDNISMVVCALCASDELTSSEFVDTYIIQRLSDHSFWTP